MKEKKEIKALTKALYTLLIALSLIIVGCGDNSSSAGGVNEFLGRLNGKFPEIPPSALTVASVSAKTVTVSWPPVSGADGYLVYYYSIGSYSGSCDSYSNSSYSLADSTASESYTQVGLSPNYNYCYKVSAYNAYGETAKSPSRSAKTLSLPAAPARLTVTTVSSDYIDLTWDQVSGAAGYYVYRSTSSSGANNVVGKTMAAELSYKDTGLALITTYYYWVAACNSFGEGGAQSSYVGATTKPVIGSFTDGRDGRAYRTTKIGNKTWMADNMNYQTGDSWCYLGAVSNCDKYGRLYNWNTAKAVCPAGWHLPTYKEWEDLIAAVGGSSGAGKKLKAASGWGSGGSYNGTDLYGFSALPGGLRSNEGVNVDVGYGGYWWTSTDNESGVVYGRRIIYTSDNVSEVQWDADYSLSVRCVID